MPEICLLPQPREVAWGTDAFDITTDAIIVLPEAADDRDLSAARRLQHAIAEFAGVGVALAKRADGAHPGPMLLLARADRDAAFVQPDEAEIAPQGYRLTVSEAGVRLIGADAPGLFHGVQTLVQILDQAGRRLPAVRMVDAPALAVRGVMLDVSRGKVPTTEAVLELVELLAGWKINHFQLYIEHTFAWPSHPKIGHGHDPFSADDILRIDAACAERHIEFVPNLQSFGHQGHMLQLRAYSHLAESDAQWTLSPAEPGVYTLLDELYAEFLPNFRSRQFNVDSDETWDLGTGKTAERVAEVGLGRVYLDHILRLRELAAARGRTIQFWGDIIVKYPELIAEIPDDVTVLQWDYRADPIEEDVRRFAEAGVRFYVCPGTNSWSAYFPRQAAARGNIGHLAQYAVQYGATGMLNTDWGDGGHYNMLGLSYYAYAYGAAESWNPGATSDFDDTFGRLTFGVGWEAVMGAMRALERIVEPVPGLYLPDSATLQQGILTGSMYRTRLSLEAVGVVGEAAARAGELLAHVAGRTRQPLVVAELQYAVQMETLLAKKMGLGLSIREAYADAREPQDLRIFADWFAPLLRGLAAEAAQMPDALAPLWRARAREAGLAPVQEWQRTVATDLESAAAWLTQAAITAVNTGAIPDLPPINDAWKPPYWKLQMGCD